MVVVAHDAKVYMEMRTPSPGAPRWAAERFRRLAEWFARSPFYGGSPLVSAGETVRAENDADGDSELHVLRDASGRCCCTMSVREMRRVIDGDAP